MASTPPERPDTPDKPMSNEPAKDMPDGSPPAGPDAEGGVPDTGTDPWVEGP